jgi:hypothetical protein
MHVAAQQVASEGGVDATDSDKEDEEQVPANVFLPRERKRRQDWVAGEPLREAARLYWEHNTRVTECRKNVVPMPDGAPPHAVHWLEHTIQQFYEAFLAAGDPIGSRHYETHLRVQHVPKGTTSATIRAAIQQWRPSRVNSRAKGTHFYVIFSDKSSCISALRAAQSGGFALKATVRQRPRMGITAFTIERPVYVKDVSAVTCAWQRCYGIKLLFKALISFPDWESSCPRVSELIEDVRNCSSPFAPSLDSLLDVLLCDRNCDTGFADKRCCYGDCESCGWDVKVGELDPSDTVEEKDNDDMKERELFVSLSSL